MVTKKVCSAGRFGSRYGVEIRKRIVKVEKKQKSNHECPECTYLKVKRQAKGIFSCNKCGLIFTGGAYYPVTLNGNIVKSIISQKSFLSNMNKLIESQREEELLK